MNKKFLLAAGAVAVLSLASCSGHNDKACASDGTKCDQEEVYTGVLPAADCAGVRYTLHVDYDDDGRDGDYKLVETYLDTDSVAPLGLKDKRTFASEGDFTVENKDGKKYLKLVKDVRDSQAGSIETPLYLLVDSDSTLTLTNDALEVSQTPGLNYTLKIAR